MSLSFDTYADLTESVVEMTSRSDARALVPGWIQMVESRYRYSLFNALDTMVQTGTTELAFVPGQDFIDLPDDCFTLLHLEIQTDPLRFVNIVSLSKLTDITAGSPQLAFPMAMAAIGPRRMKLAPIPTEDTNYVLNYYANEAQVDQSKVASEILKDAPGLILYGVCVEVATWSKDIESLPMYQQQEAKYLDAYKRRLLRNRFGGGSVRMRIDNQPYDGHRQARR